MQFTFKNLMLVALMALFATGCATMQSRWKDATSVNTIEFYEEFLERYPQGEFSNEARKRLQWLYFNTAKEKDTIQVYTEFLRKYPDSELSDEVHARLAEKVRVIRLIVEQDYEEEGKLPIEKDITLFLEGTGLFSVVKESAITYDATLKIKIIGKINIGWADTDDTDTIGFRYYDTSGNLHIDLFTEARISGTIELETEGIAIYNQHFHGSDESMEMDEIKEDFFDAICSAFLNSDFIQKLEFMIENLYGSHPAINGLIRLASASKGGNLYSVVEMAAQRLEEIRQKQK